MDANLFFLKFKKIIVLYNLKKTIMCNIDKVFPDMISIVLVAKNNDLLIFWLFIVHDLIDP